MAGRLKVTYSEFSFHSSETTCLKREKKEWEGRSVLCFLFAPVVRLSQQGRAGDTLPWHWPSFACYPRIRLHVKERIFTIKTASTPCVIWRSSNSQSVIFFHSLCRLLKLRVARAVVEIIDLLVTNVIHWWPVQSLQKVTLPWVTEGCLSLPVITLNFVSNLYHRLTQQFETVSYTCWSFQSTFKRSAKDEDDCLTVHLWYFLTCALVFNFGLYM